MRLADAIALAGLAAFVASLGIGVQAASAYINGSGPATPASVCAILRSNGMVQGASNGGRTLRSVSCSDDGHNFVIRGRVE